MEYNFDLLSMQILKIKLYYCSSKIFTSGENTIIYFKLDVTLNKVALGDIC